MSRPTAPRASWLPGRQQRPLLPRLLFLKSLALHAVEDPTQDGDAGPSHLQRAQRFRVEAESFDADDHELVGIDHDQEAGGADQALCPDPCVAEGHTDETRQENVEDPPGT